MAAGHDDVKTAVGSRTALRTDPARKQVLELQQKT